MGVHDKDKYPEIKRLLGIPEDEPIFILRAQDKCSFQTLIDYEDNVADVGADDIFLNGILKVQDEFSEWQGKNTDKVKTPD